MKHTADGWRDLLESRWPDLKREFFRGNREIMTKGPDCPYHVKVFLYSDGTLRRWRSYSREDIPADIGPGEALEVFHIQPEAPEDDLFQGLEGKARRESVGRYLEGMRKEYIDLADVAITILWRDPERGIVR